MAGVIDAVLTRSVPDATLAPTVTGMVKSTVLPAANALVSVKVMVLPVTTSVQPAGGVRVPKVASAAGVNASLTVTPAAAAVVPLFVAEIV